MILSVTWANHYSALKNLLNRKTYCEFDLVGVDGIYLRYLLRSKKNRSSADLTLASVFRTMRLRVILVGSSEKKQSDILREFESQFPLVEVVKQMNGYDQLSSDYLAEYILREVPEVVVIGLGPVKQEEFLIELMKNLEMRISNNLLLVTCGGWLDQIIVGHYYPQFAYKFKLNWLVRFSREPKRLWKRYTIFALVAWRRRNALRDYFQSLSGYQKLEQSQKEIDDLIKDFLQDNSKKIS
jgi:exopolysaccharide biosynthesis WecB/TagA/CpsF family protein